MNYKELNAQELVHKLSYAGEYPHPDLIKAICERRAETEPLLLALFAESYDDNWPSDDDPRWYRFFHAGKFMIAWQNADALPVFAKLYSDDVKQDWLESFEEDLYYFGPPAIPYLQQVVNKESDGKWHYGQGLCGSTLQRIAVYYPETREEIAAIFRALLPSPDAIPAAIDEMWGDWAMELGQLADEASRAHILALDDAGVLSGDFYGRQSYLREMNRGFKSQNPPKPLAIQAEYRRQFEWYQRALREEEKRKRQQRESRVRQASLRSEPKVGRNAPCPCGSGKKYKKCHGRPGA